MSPVSYSTLAIAALFSHEQGTYLAIRGPWSTIVGEKIDCLILPSE